MYGPRPGDRVCKVNFSRLSDFEKKSTNLLLAKQDHEIVFDSEGDYYVANVKFVKSPQRSTGLYGSGQKNTSKSPEGTRKIEDSKSPGSRKYISKPAIKPAPTSGKKQTQNSKRNLGPTDRSKGKTVATDRSQSPKLTKFQPTDKLELIKEYQPFFPKSDLSDQGYRPIMIGKSIVG